ncbi:MAG: peptidylprolyl isomerase [Aggregatilineales bacterium]
MSRFLRIFALATLMFAVLTACGGGDSASTTDSGDAPEAIATQPVSDPVDTVDSGTPIVDPAEDATPTPENFDADSQAVNAQVQQAVANATAPEPQIPINAAGQEVLARVNGEDITRAQFEGEFARRQAQSDAADLNALAATVMDTLIEQTLIRQAAANLSLSIPPEEIEAEVAANREMIGGEDAWQAWLITNGYTEAEYRAEILPNSLLTPLVVGAVTQIPQNVNEVRARHILVSTEAEARDVLTRLQAGEDFVALAAEVSNDVTTRNQGGDLGWFIAETLTTPELARVALQLQPGQVAGPVTTILGYHIIQTLEINERQAEPAEQAQIIQTQFESWLDEQYASATIERFLY